MKRTHRKPTKDSWKHPRKRKITVARARQSAARHVMARMFGGVPVKDGEKCKWSAYNVRRKDVWLVFPKPDCEPVPIAFQSSQVIVVCKRTGRVLYEGSTNDEG